MTPGGGRLLLALDTCTRTASVALLVLETGEIAFEVTWLAGREHSAQLLTQVQRGLDLLDAAITDVGGIAVARGPGSFTGMRVGISVAQGLAEGLGVPLWGFSSHDVLAVEASWSDRPVWALVDVGRGRVALATFEHGVTTSEPRIVPGVEVAEMVAPPAVVIGDVSPELAALLAKRAAGADLAVLSGPRRAGRLARLGWQAWRLGLPGDPAQVDAIYLAPATSARVESTR